MIIATEYATKFNALENLNDSDFLLRFIWYIKHLFSKDLVLIKNAECQFIAFSDAMMQEFNFSEHTLGKTILELPNFDETLRNQIYKQEQQILMSRENQYSFYFHQKGDETHNYLIYKRGLINPATNNIVGLFVRNMPWTIGVYRKFIMENFAGNSARISETNSNKLSFLQQQVLFCLLLGITHRKEISSMLSSITHKPITENQVKNTLQSLYNQFDCNYPSALVELILQGKISFVLPENTIPSGNYTLPL